MYIITFFGYLDMISILIIGGILAIILFFVDIIFRRSKRMPFYMYALFYYYIVIVGSLIFAVFFIPFVNSPIGFRILQLDNNRKGITGINCSLLSLLFAIS